MATVTYRILGAQTRLPRGGIPADSGDGDRSCRRWASAISEGGGGWGGQADQGEGIQSLLSNLITLGPVPVPPRPPGAASPSSAVQPQASF